jgi:predicted DNA-binding WGR domain protein
MILLARIDPGARMNRWYLVHIQPTLVDEIAVVCAWGSRENPFQQMRAIPAESALAAQQLAGQIVAQKLQRGYVPVDSPRKYGA